MTKQDTTSQITLKVLPKEVYEAFKKLLAAKGNINVKPVDVTLELINSRMIHDIPPAFNAEDLKRYSNTTGHSTKKETIQVSQKVSSSWAVSVTNTTSVGVEISYKGVFPEVGELGAKISTSFTHSESKKIEGRTEKTITKTDELSIAPGDNFASLVVLRSKKFNNSEMESTYKVLDMNFSGVRIPFPKEELIPKGEYTTTSAVTADFSDAAFALTKIEDSMTNEQILDKAVKDLGWGN